MRKVLLLSFLGITSFLKAEDRYINDHSGMVEQLIYLNESVLKISDKIKEIQEYNIQRDQMILKLLNNLNEVANEYKTITYSH